MIRDISKETGVTSVVISHDMASTFRIADRISMLHEGTIIESGAPNEILGSQHEYVRAFVEMSGSVRMKGRARLNPPAGERKRRRPSRSGSPRSASRCSRSSRSSSSPRAWAARAGITCGRCSTTRPAWSTSRRVQVAGLTIGENPDRRLDGGSRVTTVASSRRSSCGRTRPCSRSPRRCSASTTSRSIPGTPESPEPLTGQIVTNHLLAEGEQIKNVVEAVTIVGHPGAQSNETLPVCRQILLDVQRVTRGPIRQIAESVKEGVDKNSLAAQQLLRHLDDIALDVRGMTAGKASDDFKKTISNMREITESVKSLVGSGEGQVNSAGEKIKSNLDKISIAIDNLNHTMANVSQVSDKVASARAPSGACSTTTPSPTMSSRSPPT